MNTLILLLCVVPLFSSSVSRDSRIVSADEANNHIAARAQPIVPALARTLKVGGKVVLTVRISSTGDVSSVRMVSGHPMLVQAAIDAVRKWKYKPFIENGVPTEVVTEVTIDFSSGMSSQESEARNKFFPAEDECRQSVTKRDLAKAESQCKNAVVLSDLLPQDAKLERSDARAMMGHALYLQQRYKEAVPWYTDALNIDQEARKPNDADLGSSFANLGRALAKTGNLAEADSLYAKSVSTFQDAIKSLPSMKDNYTKRLKRFLGEYAALKDTEGQSDAANELRRKAESY